MLPLDLLGVPFAWAVHLGVQMPGICAPMVGIKTGEAEGLEQRFQLEKNIIFAAAKDIGQNSSCVMIDRVPQPALVPFLADKAPHLVDLSFPSLLNVHEDLIWVHGT